MPLSAPGPGRSHATRRAESGMGIAHTVLGADSASHTLQETGHWAGEGSHGPLAAWPSEGCLPQPRTRDPNPEHSRQVGSCTLQGAQPDTAAYAHRVL